MRMKSILLTSLRAFSSVTFAALLFSPLAHAGCGEYQAVGWIANADSGEMIESLGAGTVIECGNVSGAFAGFQTPNFYAGHATCLRECEKGFKPRVTYVKVGEKWAPGKVTPGENATCVQQKSSNRKYCWNS